MTGFQPQRKLSQELTRVGQVLSGRYKLEQLIGKGGMAVVYRALDIEMQRHVAVKMMLPQIEDDGDAVERFEREAKSASKLSHRNVVELIDYGTSQAGLKYLVIEFLDGESLADVLKHDGAIDLERGIHIFMQVCDAMACAHDRNLIHRDLKPSNIMLVADHEGRETVKIVDFGLAKAAMGTESQRLTQTGDVFGSPTYMAPEQCRGNLLLDGRVDIYALGVVMFESLLGRLPFMADNVLTTITQKLHNPPPAFKTIRPDLYIPDEIEAIVLKALATDPRDRFQSMLELRDSLQGYLTRKRGGRKGASAAPAAEAAGSGKMVLMAACVLATLVFVAGLGGVAFWFLSNSSHSPSSPARTGSPTRATDPSAPGGQDDERRPPPTEPARPTQKVESNSTKKPSSLTTKPGTTSSTARSKSAPGKTSARVRTTSTSTGTTSTKPTSNLAKAHKKKRKRSGADWYDFQEQREGRFSEGDVWTPATGGGSE